MTKVLFIFGGSGYIGTKIVEDFIHKNLFDSIIIGDLKPTSIHYPNVKYMHVDVRNDINLKIDNKIDLKSSWIFNLAAIHREPGHESNEYFDTNISGAENVNAFAEKTGIKNVLFTSSIAPYGRSLEERNEYSQLYAETPYGISKSLAEKIHQIWKARDNSRRLIIVRPSVIYGPEDPGNVLRMIKALQKGTFFFPGSTDIIKAHGYVYGLVESIIFAMNKNDPIITYNYAENPVIPIGEMCTIIKKHLRINKPTPKIPMPALIILSMLVQIFYKIIKKNSSIHPVRVRKAGFPTNIKPQWLIDNKFKFKYGFEKSLLHWLKTKPEDFNNKL